MEQEIERIAITCTQCLKAGYKHRFVTDYPGLCSDCVHEEIEGRYWFWHEEMKEKQKASTMIKIQRF